MAERTKRRQQLLSPSGEPQAATTITEMTPTGRFRTEWSLLRFRLAVV
jgi:hypothetical protein